MYQVGLRKARNCVVHPYGGISKRHGTRFLEPVKDHSKKVRLLPFKFKDEDQYILEFGDQYIRFMRNDGHILDTSEQENITNITQGNPAVVTAASHPFSDGQEVFIQSVSGMTEVNNTRFKLINVTTNTFALLDQVTGIAVNSFAFTGYTSGGTVDLIFEITSPYAEADLFDIVYTQNADVMTLTHRLHAPRELTRTDHDIWTLTEIAFLPTLPDPTTLVVTVNTSGSETERYLVTAIDNETGEESLPGVNTTGAETITGATQANPVRLTVTATNFINGDELEVDGIVGMTELNGRRFTVTNKQTNTVDLLGENGTGHTAYSSAGTAAPTWVEITNGNTTPDNTISWAAVTNADKYAIYKRDGVYGIIGESETTSFLDDNIAPNTSISPPFSRNPFANNNHPSSCAFYEQRRVFGGSDNNPDTNWFSQTTRISNFNVHLPVIASDAITATLSGNEVSRIKQYIPTTDLLVLTGGSEWQVNSGPDSVLSPDTIQQKPQTSWGSSFRQPLIIGSTYLFVTRNENSIRSLGFQLQLDGYDSDEMFLLSHHLIENDTIVDWSMTRVPETRLHCVLASGLALAMTFDEKQEVVAWCPWDTDGNFESTAGLSGGGNDNEDSIYFVVQRILDGNTVRYIEVWRQEFFDVIEDAFFVDSGVTLDNPITITNIASDGLVTATGHGLSDGDTVDVNDIIWEIALDKFGNDTTVDILNGDTFTIDLVNSNSFYLTLVVQDLWKKLDDEINVDDTAANPPNILALANPLVAMDFGLGGTRIFYLEDDAATLVQVDLRIAFDLDTIDTDSKKTVDLSADTGLAFGNGLFLHPEGTKFWIKGSSGDRDIIQWRMDTAWDVTTKVFEKKFVAWSSGEFNKSIKWSDDGQYFYMSQIQPFDEDKIRQWRVPTTFDLAGAVELTAYAFVQSGNFLDEDTQVLDFFFTDDGRDIWLAVVLEEVNVPIRTQLERWRLNTPWVVGDGLVKEKDVLVISPTSIPGEGLQEGTLIIRNNEKDVFMVQIREDGAHIEHWGFPGPTVDGLSVFSVPVPEVYRSDGVVRKVITSIDIDHLDCPKIVILADGDVIAEDSSLAKRCGNLSVTASRAHLGLRYIADIETLDIESLSGTTQGQKKKTTDVVIRFRNSRGLLIGPNSDNLVEMKQRENENWGEPTQLLTGDKKIHLKPDWNSNGRIFLRNFDPLPMTILAIMPQIDPGDEE